MNTLCRKLKLESIDNFNGLINYISNSKRLNEEYKMIKEEILHKSEEMERYKIEIISYKKQILFYCTDCFLWAVMKILIFVDI